MPERRWLQFCLLSVIALAFLTGCHRKSETSENSEKENPGRVEGTYAHMLPENTIAYVRIKDAQNVLRSFVYKQHVKDADKIQKQLNEIINARIGSLGDPRSGLGIKALSLLSFLGELEEIHLGFAATKQQLQTNEPDVVAIVKLRGTTGLESIRKDLADHPHIKLSEKTIGDKKLHIVDVGAGPKGAYYHIDSNTVVLGLEANLTALLENKGEAKGKTLAQSAKFRNAVKLADSKRQIFIYGNIEAGRSLAKAMAPPRRKAQADAFNKLMSIGSMTATIGLDGGTTLRAFAADGKEFPKFLVRTPRQKTFLSRIPADAVFLMSQGIEGGKETRKNFVEWVMEELKPEDKGRQTLVPSKWAKVAEIYSADPQRIEYEAFTIVDDMWIAVIPVKSEMALFVAPDSQGRWGAAFLFDIEDKDQVKKLTQKVFEAGNRAKLPWKETEYQGLKIRYLDFAEIARDRGRAVPPELSKLAQLQVGYAEGDELFYVGTLESIKFAHKPTGRTLADEFTYENVDEKNALMISLRPGRILHQTFGVEKVDRVLEALANQIPKDSNYQVTVNFEPKQLTFRTNIPFISLAGWLAVEFLGDGPAHLKKVLPPKSEKRGSFKEREKTPPVRGEKAARK